MARPTKYNPETVARIVDAIERGATYDLAAAYAGLTYETFRVWREEKAAFSAAIKDAEGRAAYRWLKIIDDAAEDGNWTAAAWKLERRYPNEYGRRVEEQQHSGEIRITYVNDWRGEPTQP